MSDPAAMRLIGIGAFGAGGFAAGLIGLCAGNVSNTARRVFLIALAIAAIGAALASGAVGFFHELGRPILGLGSAILLVQAMRSERVARGMSAALELARRPRWQWMAMAIGCPAMAAPLLLQFGTPEAVKVEPIEPHPVVLIPPLKMLPVNTAITDAGHDLTLWTTMDPVPPAEDLAAAEWHELSKQNHLAGVIRTAPPDRSYNCHGWIFTGSHCFIPDWAVDSILEDNGYRIVDHPAVGDLVIYRNPDGAAIHSARVWAIGEDGQILLESKWGWMGRYLHRPELSPYGGKWTYYNSRRHGHILQNRLDSLPETAKGAAARRDRRRD